MAEKQRILVVDDEHDYVDVLKDRLVFEGFEVDVAYDGPSGLAQLTAAPPSLVLLDVMMPGMNGFEFVRRMREAPGGDAVPVIFVTAYGRQPSEAELALIGDAPFIRKPFEVDELVALIRETAAKPRSL
jgi:DNA-binding response OmpR family regulator